MIKPKVKPTPKKARGKKYDIPKMFAAICEKISDGASLRSVCQGVDMPNKKTVNDWLADPKNSALRVQYAIAVEERAVALAEDSLVEARLAVGKDHAGVSAQRLIVDTLKWHASKMSTKYGDRIGITDGDGKPLPTAQVMPVFNITVKKD